MDELPIILRQWQSLLTSLSFESFAESITLDNITLFQNHCIEQAHQLRQQILPALTKSHPEHQKFYRAFDYFLKAILLHWQRVNDKFLQLNAEKTIPHLVRIAEKDYQLLLKQKSYQKCLAILVNFGFQHDKA